MNTELLISLLDLMGTFVFAISGAQAARESELDIFGIITIAFLTACGGGIIRDICIGVVPPSGLTHWPYLALTLLASIMVIGFYNLIEKLSFPVILFDAIGLAIFSVAGTQKSIFLGFNYEVAILLGVLSAIGGGIIRDVLLRRIPLVLRKEVYGSAALIGSSLYAISHFSEVNVSIGTWVGILSCFLVRYFSIKNKWNLPSFKLPSNKEITRDDKLP